MVFSARCNIYISRLCYDASVRLSVTFVHCGHRVRLIPDTFACLARVEVNISLAFLYWVGIALHP